MDPMQKGGAMPMPSAQVAPAQAGGGARQLVSDIHDKMIELQNLMSKSKAVTPDDLAQYQALVNGYESFVDNLSQAPGPKPQAPTPRGPASMEAGMNPNAKPAL